MFLVLIIIHFYAHHNPTTGGHFTNRHWRVLSLYGATASTHISEPGVSLLLLLGAHLSMFSGKTACVKMWLG